MIYRIENEVIFGDIEFEDLVIVFRLIFKFLI